MVFTIGPALGGLLYEWSGFSGVFTIITALQVVIAGVIIAMIQPLRTTAGPPIIGEGNGESKGAAVAAAAGPSTSLVSESGVASSTGRTNPADTEPVSAWSFLFASRMSVFGGFCNAAIFATFGFYDNFLAGHLKATLGFNAFYSGITFCKFFFDGVPPKRQGQAPFHTQRSSIVSSHKTSSHLLRLPSPRYPCDDLCVRHPVHREASVAGGVPQAPGDRIRGLGSRLPHFRSLAARGDDVGGGGSQNS